MEVEQRKIQKVYWSSNNAFMSVYMYHKYVCIDLSVNKINTNQPDHNAGKHLNQQKDRSIYTRQRCHYRLYVCHGNDEHGDDDQCVEYGAPEVPCVHLELLPHHYQLHGASLTQGASIGNSTCISEFLDLLIDGLSLSTACFVQEL
ncbi:hypothetical protein Tco_0562243 [Tanacetum coccineum]